MVLPSVSDRLKSGAGFPSAAPALLPGSFGESARSMFTAAKLVIAANNRENVDPAA
jgi:hypothetical protein